MPFKSKAQAKTCKYCVNPAKKNLTSGRNKGYYRTCGSENCLTAQYKDRTVGASKVSRKPKTCIKCEAIYISTSASQKWCQVCVPNIFHRKIIQRYNLSATEYDELIALNKGKCAICLTRRAKAIDHNHQTGQVRGAICHHCNTCLHLIENRVVLQRALDYLGVEL